MKMLCIWLQNWYYISIQEYPEEKKNQNSQKIQSETQISLLNLNDFL